MLLFGKEILRVLIGSAAAGFPWEAERAGFMNSRRSDFPACGWIPSPTRICGSAYCVVMAGDVNRVVRVEPQSARLRVSQLISTIPNRTSLPFLHFVPPYRTSPLRKPPKIKDGLQSGSKSRCRRDFVMSHF